MSRITQIVFILFGFSTSIHAELQTVPYVDVNQYVGTWYQIAKNPHFFEAGCVCSMQKLGVLSKDTLSVYNSCNDKTTEGSIRSIEGTAVSDDPVSNSKFTVDFNLSYKGKYWIIGLDPQYRYAVVSDPSMYTLYILSKTPVLSDELYQEAVNEAAKQLDTSKLEKTLQEGCTYP